MATDPVSSFITSPGVMATIGFGFGAILVLWIFQKFDVFQGTDWEKFQPKSMEDLVKPKIDNTVKSWGSPNNSKIRKDLRTIGICHRMTSMSEIPASDPRPGDGEREEKLSDSEKDRIMDEMIGQHEKTVVSEYSSEPVRILWIKPKSLILRPMFYLIDVLFDSDVLGKKMIVPESKIRDTPKGVIQISRDVEFTPFAGLEMAKDKSSFAAVSGVSFQALYEQGLEDQQNYHKQVNHFASQFNQTLQKLEKQADIERAKYSNSLDSDLTND